MLSQTAEFYFSYDWIIFYCVYVSIQDGHARCLHILATVNNASMNTRAHYAMLVYTGFHRNALLSGAEGNMNYVFFNLSFLWQFQLHECRCFVLLEKLLAHRGHKINIFCWLSSLLFWEAALSSGYLEILMIPLEAYGLVSHRDDVQTLWLLDIPTLIPDFVLWDEKNNIF